VSYILVVTSYVEDIICTHCNMIGTTYRQFQDAFAFYGPSHT